MTYFHLSLNKIIASFTLVFCLIASGKTLANETVLEVAKIIEETYVLPEIAKKTALKLRSKVKAGDYKQLANDTKELAKALSKDMVEISNDQHMFIEFLGSKEEQKKQEQGFEDWWMDRAPSVNFGVTKVEILQGNIGYLKYTSFYPIEMATPALQAAMTMLKNTNGLILDLRRNGGGEESTAGALMATFLPEASEHPFYIEYRNKKITEELPKKLAWGRYDDAKKLVILVNDKSFSASEAVAFSLQEVGRATIVGKKSIGGAHMLDFNMISNGFSVGIPDRRPIGKNQGKTGKV